MNNQTNDSNSVLRNSTMSVLSGKKKKATEIKHRKFGKDIVYLKLAIKTIKSIFRMKRNEKHLVLILMNELIHIDLCENEVPWEKIVSSFDNKSDLLGKQLLILFASKYLNKYRKTKELTIEMKKNLTKTSQFNFKLLHSMSFNEESELKAIKNHIIQVILNLFDKLLKVNYNDDTLMLGVLRLGSVGNFSEDVIMMVLNKMLDMDIGHVLMIICYKYQSSDHLQNYILTQNTKDSALMYKYNYYSFINSDNFENKNIILQNSNVCSDLLVKKSDNKAMNTPINQTVKSSLNFKSGASQTINNDASIIIPKELMNKSNLRIGMKIPKKSNVLKIKLSTLESKKSCLKGRLVNCKIAFSNRSSSSCCLKM
jgi:hypothetical protein